MPDITFHDISAYQGDYDDDNPVIAIKMSGGDAGLYYDSKATINYNRAATKGKAIIGYHFAGGTDPFAEADFFIRAMSPLAENDILALDWEVSHPDPVGWCTNFVNHVHDVTGIWPLIYMNTSTCTAHDWSPVLANCGLWIADYRFTPEQDVPCGHPYIIHQYQGSPLDTDALFIPIETLREYGYHTPSPAPVPTPPATPPTPVDPTPPAEQGSGTNSEQPPTPQPEPLPPSPAPVVVEPPHTPAPQPSGGWLYAFLSFLRKLLGFK